MSLLDEFDVKLFKPNYIFEINERSFNTFGHSHLKKIKGLEHYILVKTARSYVDRARMIFYHSNCVLVLAKIHRPKRPDYYYKNESIMRETVVQTADSVIKVDEKGPRYLKDRFGQVQDTTTLDAYRQTFNSDLNNWIKNIAR